MKSVTLLLTHKISLSFYLDATITCQCYFFSVFLLQIPKMLSNFLFFLNIENFPTIFMSINSTNNKKWFKKLGEMQIVCFALDNLEVSDR